MGWGAQGRCWVDGILEMKGHEEGELTVEEEEIRVLVEQKAEYLWEALLVELEYKRSKEEREERRRVVSMAKLKNSEGRGRDKVVRIVNKDEMDEEWWIGLTVGWMDRWVMRNGRDNGEGGGGFL
jgi:hypothetical protein